MKNGIIKRLFISMVVVVTAAGAPAQSMWNRQHLEDVKQQLDRPYYSAAYSALIQEADKALDARPLSVMDKFKIPASGDKHDYMSMARYSWPDPTKPDGLPYITRDGETNPEMRKLDRIPLSTTAGNINNLALAYYFSGDEKYAKKATELIRVWFLDKKTRMNPNLNYAQMMPGHDGDRGRSYGLIDTYSLVDMVNAVELLEGSKSFTSKDSKALKQWFRKLTDWMLTSKQGKEENNNANNHSVAYDAQIIAFALYTGDKALAEKKIREFPERRLYPQIKGDGSQPHELRRTRAYHYSWYNLTHFVDIMLMAKNIGIDISQMTSPEGANLYKAFDFITPYISKGQAAWPYQEIGDWDGVVQNLVRDLYRTGMYLDPSRKDYVGIYNKYRVLHPAELFNLIYVQPDAADDAFSRAGAQLKLAAQIACKAKEEEPNKSKNQFAPRSINNDGTLALVRPRDWCSGFFGGSLWQMYDYTNNKEWADLAAEWTRPVEPMKNCKETHDLGFTVYDSFGNGYRLTGDEQYKDVVITAANSLITRYNPTIGCIRSWDHHADVWPYPVIIDNMMNLELLFEASKLTGDSIYHNIAVSHADKTMKNHFRPDYSSCHVVNYDASTGEATGQYTHQGCSDDSFWSRGQGWGLYGYAMCYRYTGDRKYLDQSEHIADFIMSLPNMPADKVPYWDMKYPTVVACTPDNPNAEVPRDASAAAVIASGLYELSTYAEADKAKKYRAYADEIVDNLTDHYMAEPGSHYGFILLHSVGNYPAGSEIDAPINYADYYYLEALNRRESLRNMEL